MPQYDKADIQRRMDGAVESLKGDLSGLRTGRANTSLLDPVVVEVYGAMMPLSQVATVNAPEPRINLGHLLLPMSPYTSFAKQSFNPRQKA